MVIEKKKASLLSNCRDVTKGKSVRNSVLVRKSSRVTRKDPNSCSGLNHLPCLSQPVSQKKLALISNFL
jgi:hypothetical protein